jgi:hypothetical protein
MLGTWVPDMNTPLFVTLKTFVCSHCRWIDLIWFSKLPCSFPPWRSNLIENSSIDDLFSYIRSIRYRWPDSEWTFRWLGKTSCKTQKRAFWRYSIRFSESRNNSGSIRRTECFRVRYEWHITKMLSREIIFISMKMAPKVGKILHFHLANFK